MTFYFLEEIKSFLEKEVCSEIKLKRPPQNEEALDFLLTHPTVQVGWFDADLTAKSAREKLPAIIIGINGDIEFGEEKTIPIVLGLVAFNGGTLTKEKTLIPDGSGFADILNFMDLCVRKLSTKKLGEDLYIVPNSISCRPDNEGYYDFWLGQVTFNVSALGHQI